MTVGAPPSGAAQLPAHLLRTFLNPLILLGLLCAFIAAATWTLAISRTELSFAYPFTGLGIVFTLLFSSLLFGERVPPQRWAGVAIVCFGLWVAAKGK